MKGNHFLYKLIARYWTARDFRRIREDVGPERFEDYDWRKEAAFKFVCDNEKECKKIFKRKGVNNGKSLGN